MDELVLALALDELENLGLPVENEANIPTRVPIEGLTDDQFINMFRVSKKLFNFIAELVSPYLPPKVRETDLAVADRVLAALRFFATGNTQLDVAGDIFVHVSRQTISRCIKQVVNALNEQAIFRRFVRFDMDLESLNTKRQRFYQLYKHPGIVGCIFGTHVAIIAPKSDDEENPEYIYINRKNYHSLNVQLVCDADLRITYVSARFPGSCHDSHIWNRSTLKTPLEDLHHKGQKDYFLLGDSGFPLRSYLITPFHPEPQEGTPQHQYNALHRRIQGLSIERVNSILKSRFRCLLKHQVLHYSPVMAGKIVNACVVLHNLCVEHNLTEIPHDDVDPNDLGMYDNPVVPEEHGNADDMGRVDPDLVEGRRTRNRLLDNL